MRRRMTTVQLFALADKTVGSDNARLLERARLVENSSPPPRHAIHLWDLLLAMREKERLGINFNRSVTMSMESRWEVVNSLTVEFLEEVISLNDQLSEEANKQARQLMNLILARTQRMGMASRIEQMAGLLMHITFYRTVLMAKLGEMQQATSFLLNCSELLGFSHPNQIMARYSALKLTLNEISEDYEHAQTVLTTLQEGLTLLTEEGVKEHLTLRKLMAEMHRKLTELHTEILEQELIIEEKEQLAMKAEVEMKNIKSSITHCYALFMAYKGLECRETDPVAQIHEVGIRLAISQAAVKAVEEQLVVRAGEVTESQARKAAASKDSGTGSNQEYEDDEIEYSSAYWDPDDSDDSAPGLNHGEGAARGGPGATGGRGRGGSTDRGKGGRRRSSVREKNRSMNRRTLHEDKDGGLVARACAEVVRQRAMASARDKPSSWKCLAATDSSSASCDGVTRQQGSSAYTKRRRMAPDKHPFSSIDSYGRRGRNRPPAICRSLSISHVESMRGRRNLDTIYEIGSRRTNKFMSLSLKDINLIRSQRKRNTGSGSYRGKDTTAKLSKKAAARVSSPPSHSVRSCDALDISSNKSTSEKKRFSSKSVGATNCGRQLNGPLALPNITASSSSHARRCPASRPLESYAAKMSDTDSKTSLCSLSRMSERVRNQINNAERFYYLSPVVCAQTTSNVTSYGVWDDGVYLGPEDATCGKKSSVRAVSCTRLVQTQSRRKVTAPKVKSAENMSLGRGESSVSSSLKPLSPSMSLKFALKRLSILTYSDSKRNDDFLQRTLDSETRPRQSSTLAEETVRQQSLPLIKHLSLSSVGNYTQSKSLNLRRSDSSVGKMPYGRPFSSVKETPSAKRFCAMSSAAATTKCYKPSLRNPHLLQQRWLHARSREKLATFSSPSAPPSAPSCKGNIHGGPLPSSQRIHGALAKLRSYDTGRDLKRNCLAILANVKLGSRWSEGQRSNDSEKQP